jgi:arylsulfatase A-like enzyme
MAPPKQSDHQAVTPARPNVLLVVTDDQRWGTLNVMPAVRRYLKRNGRQYREAFATSPLCCPSRASIMTGQYPHNHGVRRNEDADNLVHESTIQYYLQQNGYRTGIVGKYLNSWPEAQKNPPYFDKWATIDDSNYNRVYYDFTANVNGRIVRPSIYSTSFVTHKAVRFMRGFESKDAEPWFLYVAPFASHKPFRPQARYRSAPVPFWPGNPAVGESDRSDKPPWVRARNVRLPGGRAIQRDQAKTLMSADDMVKRLFLALDSLGEKRRTLVIFISDNGYMWGEHGLASKRSPYTQAVKVPLILRWRRQIEPGTKDDTLVANIDIAPTILEATGTGSDPDYPMDGRSLLSASQPRRELLLEYFGSRVGADVPSWASTISPTYQYVEYYDDTTGTVVYDEYYDLVNDPWLLDNLLGDSDPTNDPPVFPLSVDLQQARDCTGTTCP